MLGAWQMQVHGHVRLLAVEDRAPNALELLPGPLLTAWKEHKGAFACQKLFAECLSINEGSQYRTHVSRVCLKVAKCRNRTSEVQVTPFAASAANDDRGAQLLRDRYADLHSIHS